MAKRLRDWEEQAANARHITEHISMVGSGSWIPLGALTPAWPGAWRHPTCVVRVLTGLGWRDANPGTSGLLCAWEKWNPEARDHLYLGAGSHKPDWYMWKWWRPRGDGQASAATVARSMFPKRNLSIKPPAALPSPLEVCFKSTNRFRTGHIEHPLASGALSTIPYTWISLQSWHSKFFSSRRTSVLSWKCHP